jgi:signal transduction histidine kinase
LPLAVIVVNKDRRILLANKSAEIISKKTEKELINLKGGEALGCAYSSLHPDGCGFSDMCEFCQIKNAVVDSFKNKISIQLEDAFLNFKDIGQRSLRVSISYLNLDKVNGAAEGIEERRRNPGRRKYDKNKEVAVVALEDVTDFKEREKLQATFEVIGAVCHEMNQPLQTVMGFSDLLIHEDNPDIIKEKVKILLSGITKLGDLTRKLQNIKKYETRTYLSRKILDIERSAGY